MIDSLDPLFTMLLGQAPFIVAWLVGLILAIHNWSKHPRPSLLTAVAAVMSLLATFAYTILYAIVTGRAEVGDANFSVKLRVLGWTRAIIGLITLGLLFWAIFGWRAVYAPARRHVLRDEDEDEAGVRPPGGSTDIRTSRRRSQE